MSRLFEHGVPFYSWEAAHVQPRRGEVAYCGEEPGRNKRFALLVDAELATCAKCRAALGLDALKPVRVASRSQRGSQRREDGWVKTRPNDQEDTIIAAIDAEREAEQDRRRELAAAAERRVRAFALATTNLRNAFNRFEAARAAVSASPPRSRPPAACSDDTSNTGA